MSAKTMLTCAVIALLASVVALPAGAQTTPQQLKRILERAPEADLNRDGTLTADEIRLFRSQLQSQRAEKTSQPGSTASPVPSGVSADSAQAIPLDIRVTSDNPIPVNPRVYGIICEEMFVKDLVDDPEYIAALTELEFKTFNYPGGSVSYYHHPRGTGGFNIRPEEVRKSKHGDDSRFMKEGTGSDHLEQYIQIVRASGGEAVFTANILNGTVAELDEFLSRLQAERIPIASVVLGVEMHLGQAAVLGIDGYLERIKPYIKMLQTKYPQVPIVAHSTPVGRVANNATASFREWNEALAGLPGISGFSQYGWTEFGTAVRRLVPATEDQTPQERWMQYEAFTRTFPERQLTAYREDWGDDMQMYMLQWGTHLDRNTPVQGLHMANFYFFLAQYNAMHKDYFAVATSTPVLAANVSQGRQKGGVLYKDHIELYASYLYTKPFRHLFSGDKKLLAAEVGEGSAAVSSVKVLAAAGPDGKKYLYILNPGEATTLGTIHLDGQAVLPDVPVQVESAFESTPGAPSPVATFAGELALADVPIAPWSLTLLIIPWSAVPAMTPQAMPDETGPISRRNRELRDMRSDRAEISPTLEDIPYGAHKRLVLDLWIPVSGTPAPVLIFLHGGGGEKSMYRSNPVLRFCVEHGIAAASVNYRPNHENPFPGPMLDCGRAIQFLRCKAEEFNIDPARIAAKGTSLGANAAIWLAYHDDLADPDNADPVLRESSRLRFVLSSAGQTFNDMVLFRQRVYPYVNKNVPVTDEESEAKLAYRHEISAINFVTSDDPPIFMSYGYPLEPLPLPEDTPRGCADSQSCLWAPAEGEA